MFTNKEVLKFVNSSIEKKLDIVVTSVIKTLGSTYTKAGNLLVINSNGQFVGVLGSSYLHNKIFESSKEALKTKQIQIFKSIPQDESSGHGESEFLVQPFFYSEKYGALGIALKNFGKTLVRDIKDASYKILDEVQETKLEAGKFYQTIKAPYSVLIFGLAAHVIPMISMANLMGWKTTVVDLRIKKSYKNKADKFIELETLEDILKIDLDSYDASVILSHNPKTDDTYLKALLDSNISYIGMMGNKQNMKRITKLFNLEDDDRFYAPVGLDIGSNTSQAIALSICAQIEAKKNEKL
ncbi:hypothetical protein CP965_00485 [Halarcobacter mediterraneus]|uniref:Uncharacterized protein n=1 Tax=Halarcobacter mediterraneus TaxID=2023153 RepID=A0A4Q1B5Y3_9BACT|nr:XdhC family protein [Halarcobacter mediterraneus]RXK13959.1 hypothetical protein CP965_00485 [Halarcobacter mediterraneus]